MQTKDPNLTKTPIGENEAHADHKVHTDAEHGFNDNEDITATMQESVIGSEYLEHPALQPDDQIAEQTDTVDQTHAHTRDTHLQTTPHSVNSMTNSNRADHDDIEDNTTVNKGTDTFEEDVVETEHVNEGDNPARQPDRRDQEGSSPFDDNINEDTVGSAAPKSDGITDQNRYASINNAQSRILTPDEKGDDSIDPLGSINPRGMGKQTHPEDAI